MIPLNYVIYSGLKLTLVLLVYKLAAILIKLIKFARHYIQFPYEPSNWLLGDLLKVAPDFPFTDREVISDAVRDYVDRNFLKATKHHDLSVVWMSWYPIVFATSYRSIEPIYQSESRKHHIYRFIGLRDGLVNSNGSKWKSRRRMFDPLFSTKQLQQFAPVMRSIIDSTMEEMDSVTGQPIVLSNYVHSLTMDAIFETVFKLPADRLKEKKKKLIDAIGLFEDRLMVRIINPLYWNDWLFSKFEIGKQLNSLSQEGDEHFSRILDKRFNIQSPTMKSQETSINNNSYGDDDLEYESDDRPYRDMVDLIIKNQNQIDREGMLEEIVTMIAAGHETIANSLSWTIFTLGNHPDIQDRVLDEIDRIIESGDDVSDYNKINQLVYMEQVIKESLRMFPPLPVVLRHLENDVKVGDKTLLKDSVVVVFILAAHHDPSVYPEPFKFDPDRFAPEVIDSIPKYAFLPFGLGPRMCIGYRYAFTEMKIFLIQFLRRFRVKSVKPFEQTSYYIELITRPKCPLDVVITPRNVSTVNAQSM